jgi:hypothetical protein
LIADGGRVPWAGEFESKDVNDKRLSPKPLLSSSSSSKIRAFDFTESADAGIDITGEFLVEDAFALPLLVLVRLDDFGAGVRFLVDGLGISSLFRGNAPVMVKSASTCGSGCHGILCRGRVDLTTNPSLSSLKVFNVAKGVVCASVSCSLRGPTTVGFDVVATRAALDATFTLFGRGIARYSGALCAN